MAEMRSRKRQAQFETVSMPYTQSQEEYHEDSDPQEDDVFAYGKRSQRRDMTSQDEEELKNAIQLAFNPILPSSGTSQRVALFRWEAETRTSQETGCIPKFASAEPSGRRHLRTKDGLSRVQNGSIDSWKGPEELRAWQAGSSHSEGVHNWQNEATDSAPSTSREATVCLTSAFAKEA